MSQSTVPSKPHFPASQFQSAEMARSSRGNCSLSWKVLIFFASHGEESSTCLLALEPIKCCFSFSFHFSKNDDDGEDFICHSWKFLLFCQSTLLIAVLHWPCCLRLHASLYKQECTRKTKKHLQENSRSIPAHPVQDPSLTWPFHFVKEKTSHYIW